MGIFKDNKAQDYFKWYETASKDEHKLKLLMLGFQEKYFSDIRWDKIDKRLTKCIRDGKEAYSTPDIFMDLGEWKIKLRNLKKCDGRCDYKKETIYIKKSDSKEIRKRTLLHEMIHAFEEMHNEYPENLKEFLIIKLYNKLKKKIKNLDSLICRDSHFEFRVHSILFLLKSLDLDLRLKYKLGTVYAYKRKELLD